MNFAVRPGECVALSGPSGAGKSSILKMIYGNYRADRGAILVRAGDEFVDIVQAGPRRILELAPLGHRLCQPVPARHPAGRHPRRRGGGRGGGRARAPTRPASAPPTSSTRLQIPRQLWQLPPATFSGGEQQRVNIARGLAAERPILLLDEPTASLDAANRAVVVDLVKARARSGVAVIGIFHDEDVRDRLADRLVDVTRFARQAGTPEGTGHERRLLRSDECPAGSPRPGDRAWLARGQPGTDRRSRRGHGARSTAPTWPGIPSSPA